MSNTIPNIGDINSHNKQLNTFHTPSFGEDFEASMMQSQMMAQQAHHMDQYHQMQMPPQQLQDPQYNMWQQPDPANQLYNMNNTMIDPQMNYGVYDAQQQQQQMQPPTMSQPNLHYQQSPQQQSQMLMMPPPYKSPPMNAQQAPTHNQIMSSPNMNQSPHYPVPAENGTTSEDSDGSVNTLKRPSPEPLNDSPSKAGKNSGSTATAAKKPKPPRKKKKKDPNEPSKPVSAYALFFRDTQAAIKGENPNASFGEVSTIVASMWDGLAHEHKDVYKKKTEAAKKEYLKTLAVYRASIVSKGDDIEPNNKPSTPTGTNSPQSNAQSSPQTSLPVQKSPSQQQQQQQQQQLPVKREPIKSEPLPDSMAQLSNPQNSLNNQSQQYGGGNHISGMPAQNQNNVPQSISQASPYQSPYNNTNAYKSPPNANHIDYNNMNMPMSNQMHPNAAQNHQMNMAQQQQAPMHGNYGYEQQVPPPTHPNANHHPYGNSMVPPYNASPMDNVNMQQNSYGQQIPNNGPPNYGNEGYTTNSIQVNQVYNNPNLNQQPKATTTMPAQLCIRDGCPNRAIMHPDWEDEYCSNECVVLMCRNVFNDWVQVQTNNTNMHQQQNNFSIVK